MCTKLVLYIEKKTPYRVLFIRAAELVIALVFRQAIDMTAREGDQDWSRLPFLRKFRFFSASVQVPLRSFGRPPLSSVSNLSTSAAISFSCHRRWRSPREAPAMVGSDVSKSGYWEVHIVIKRRNCYEVGKQSHCKCRFDYRHRPVHPCQHAVALVAKLTER